MHGTEYTGIIGAMDNERGIKGIAKVQIMVLKAFDNNEDSISIEDINHIVEAIKYAEDNGAKVCNMSFSSKADSPELYNAMKSSSMLFVVSAGNGMPRGIAVDHSVFPAAYKLPNMITVANMNYGVFFLYCEKVRPQRQKTTFERRWYFLLFQGNLLCKIKLQR